MTLRELEQNQLITVVNQFDPSNSYLLIEHYGWERSTSNKPPVSGSHLFNLHFIIKGSVILNYNGKKRILSKNTCFLIPPNKNVQYYTDPNDPARFYWCSVSGNSAMHFFNSIGFSEEKLFFEVSETYAKKMRDAFFKAISLPNEFKRVSHLYMYESLYRIARNLFLSQINNDSYVVVPTSFSPPITKALAYIQEHYTDGTLTLEALAQELFLHPDYLGSLFKKELKVSFKTYLTQKRIHLADILIRQGEYNVALLAYRVGLPNASYFTKVYKSINSVTPSQEIAKQKAKKSINNAPPPPKIDNPNEVIHNAQVDIL